MCEICQHWARTDIRMVGGKPIAPNHHPACPHYNDSLMDVWVVSDGTSRCYVDNEQDARDAAQNEGEETNTIEKIRMHREMFENLPEFDGF